MLVEQRQPRIPEFDEVKDKVRSAVKDEKAKTQLEQKAKTSSRPSQVSRRVKSCRRKSRTRDKGRSELQTGLRRWVKLDRARLIDDPLFAAKAGDVLQPILLNQNYLVIGATEDGADLTEYAKQRETLMQQALTDRKNQVFGDYLTSVMTRMKQSGSIKV